MSKSTISIKNFNGIPCIIPNTIIEGNGFFISYNNYDKAIYGSDTTALVFGNMEKFYILNGNFMEEYKKIIECGFDSCFKFFKSKKEFINKYSN